MVTKRTKELLKSSGYDYGVLIKIWNLEVDYGLLDADGLEIKVIQDYMSDVIINEYTGNSGMINKEVHHSIDELADDLRAFITELASYHNTYLDVMWEGMSKIKDNYSLIQVCIPIIGFMWD